MAALPGMQADVYFGDTETPLPDWRAHAGDDSDDDTPTEADLAGLEAILGFSPAELWHLTEGDDHAQGRGTQCADERGICADALTGQGSGNALPGTRGSAVRGGAGSGVHAGAGGSDRAQGQRSRGQEIEEGQEVNDAQARAEAIADLEDGGTIAPEVLKDYPDLQPKAAKPAPPTASSQPPAQRVTEEVLDDQPALRESAPAQPFNINVSVNLPEGAIQVAAPEVTINVPEQQPVVVPAPVVNVTPQITVQTPAAPVAVTVERDATGKITGLKAESPDTLESP